MSSLDQQMSDYIDHSESRASSPDSINTILASRVTSGSPTHTVAPDTTNQISNTDRFMATLNARDRSRIQQSDPETNLQIDTAPTVSPEHFNDFKGDDAIKTQDWRLVRRAILEHMRAKETASSVFGKVADAVAQSAVKSQPSNADLTDPSVAEKAKVCREKYDSEVEQATATYIQRTKKNAESIYDKFKPDFEKPGPLFPDVGPEIATFSTMPSQKTFDELPDIQREEWSKMQGDPNYGKPENTSRYESLMGYCHRQQQKFVERVKYLTDKKAGKKKEQSDGSEPPSDV